MNEQAALTSDRASAPEGHLQGPHVSMGTNGSSAAKTGGDEATICCAGCGKLSAKETRFCGGCGGRLWEPCPACRHQNAVDLRYCGGCGESLQECLDTIVAEAEDTVIASTKLAETGRYVEAISLLEKVELAPHSRLRPIDKQIAERRASYAQQREEIIAKSGVVLADVKRMMAEADFRAALARASEIPEGLRGNELRSLHEQVSEKVALAQRLRAELKQGLVEKNFDGLMAVADRLSMLEPKDEQVRTIAAQLRQRNEQNDRAMAAKLLMAAQQALAANDYRKAQAALDRMPDVELDETATKVARSVRERTWLAFYIARAPYLDEATIALAERLVKLQPGDEKAAVACGQMRRKWTEGLRKRPGTPVAWSKPPAADPQALTPELAPAPAPLAEALAGKPHAPAQFVTAYGLALQAAGEGAFDLDLTPADNSWRSKIGLAGGKRSSKRRAPAWGVDLGSHSLKAICLAPAEEKGQPARIERVVYLPYERGAEVIQSKEASVGTPEYAKAAIAKLVAEHDLADCEVMVGAPGTLTLARFFELPFVSKSKFEEALRYESKMRIPLDPETLVVDHSSTDAVGKEGVKRVALVAASKEHVAARVDALREAGCKRVTATSHCLAMLNAYHADYEALRCKESGGDGLPPCVAYLNIGAKATSFVVRSGDHYWFRGLYYGADGFDRRLMREAHHQWPAVEQLRRKPSKAALVHEIDKTLRPKYDELAELIARTASQHRTEEGRGVERLLVSGGGALQFGLLSHLRS